MKNKKVILGALGSLTIAALLFVGLAQQVSANNGNGGDKGEKTIAKRLENIVRKLDPAVDVHMSGNGTVTVADAKVLSVSGTTITARVSFGAYNMDWTVLTDANTKVTREKGGATVLSGIAVGDTINFSGPINTTATVPTLTAKTVRDISLPTQTQRLFEGSLVSIGASTTPTSVVVKIGGTNYTVNVPSGISVLNKNWQIVNIGSYQAGNNVRLYGALQASTTSVIDATVIRNTSI